MHLSSTIHRLSNGLQIILHPDVTTSKVMLQLAFNTGSADETKEQFGFAHLCEHLFFTGTPLVPNIDLELAPYGAENNAWTDIDHTCFVMSGPAETLDLLLWTEQDRFNNLVPNLQKEAFITEKNVVLNEYHEEYNLEPYGQMWLRHPEFLFTESHPYGHPVVGNLQTLNQATTAAVKDFVSQHYRPNNATLMISGNFQVPSTLENIQRYFETIPTGVKPLSQSKQIEFDHQVLHITDNAEQSYLYLEWLLPAKDDQSIHTFVVLSELLSGIPYGILYQKMELQDQEVNDIEVYVNQHRLLSHFTISAAPIAVSPSTIKEQIIGHLQKIIQNGISDITLKQVKQKMYFNWLLQMSNLWTRSEQMMAWYLTYNTMDSFATQQNNWMNVQKQDIYQAINLLLTSAYKEIHCTPSVQR